MDFSGLTIVQLLEEHNRLSNPDGQLTKWTGAKSLLAESVTNLRDAERKARAPRTIKQAAYGLLLAVESSDHTGRPVGLPYDEILARLRDEFPDSETTDKCLRWYAVQLNTDGAKMPLRPRKPPKRRKKELVA